MYECGVLIWVEETLNKSLEVYQLACLSKCSSLHIEGNENEFELI
jgi:hypothetical protein